MKSLFALIAVALFCVPDSKPQKGNRLDKIFSSETFYITRIRFGGYFQVYDSIVFTRQADCSTVDFIPVSPYNPEGRISRELSRESLDEIRNILEIKRPFLRRTCQDEFLTIFNQTDTTLIMDTNCKDRVIDRIRQIVEK